MRIFLLACGFVALAYMLLPAHPSLSSKQWESDTLDKFRNSPEGRQTLRNLEEAFEKAERNKRARGWIGDEPQYQSWQPSSPGISCGVEYSGNSEKDRASWSMACK